MSERTTRDGGPAFPVVFPERDDALLKSQGLSMRDWFAGQALAGLCAFYVNGNPDTRERAASAAYAYADAMLKVRER